MWWFYYAFTCRSQKSVTQPKPQKIIKISFCDVYGAGKNMLQVFEKGIIQQYSEEWYHIFFTDLNYYCNKFNNL